MRLARCVGQFESVHPSLQRKLYLLQQLADAQPTPSERLRANMRRDFSQYRGLCERYRGQSRSLLLATLTVAYLQCWRALGAARDLAVHPTTTRVGCSGNAAQGSVSPWLLAIS